VLPVLPGACAVPTYAVPTSTSGVPSELVPLLPNGVGLPNATTPSKLVPLGPIPPGLLWPGVRGHGGQEDGLQRRRGLGAYEDQLGRITNGWYVCAWGVPTK